MRGQVPFDAAALVVQLHIVLQLACLHLLPPDRLMLLPMLHVPLNSSAVVPSLAASLQSRERQARQAASKTCIPGLARWRLNHVRAVARAITDHPRLWQQRVLSLLPLPAANLLQGPSAAARSPVPL